MAEKKKEKDETVLGLKLNSRLLELLAKLQEVELEDFEFEAGELEIWFQPGAVAAPVVAPPKAVSPPVKAKPTQILEAEFVPPVETYPGRVVEVKLGRRGGKSVVIGGETAPAFYTFEKPTSTGMS